MMRRHTLWLSLVFLLAVNTRSMAQLSGSKNIPGDYPDLASAITAVNAQGVGPGGLTLNLLSGNNQTAPTGGYLLGSPTLNASLSAAKPLTINGNNNTITAYTGIGTADAMFSLLGTDYVTINGLNLSENAANSTATTRMEWGYNMVKLNSTAPYDGCQNNTIQNCLVSLNAANLTSCGIRMAHSALASSVVLPVTGVTLADANSNNRFSGNRILNCDTGICIRGIALPGFYDYNTFIGGTTATAGNTFTIGGSTNANVAGVYAAFDSVMTVQYNTFNISSAQAVNTIRLAFYASGLGRGNLTFRNNTFDVSWALPANSAFAGNVYAILNDNNVGTTPPNLGHSDITAKFEYTNNLMTGVDSFATSGNMFGVYHNYADWNTDSICNNTFTDIYWSKPSASNSFGNVRCIFETGSNGIGGSRINCYYLYNVFNNLRKNGLPGSGELTAMDNASNQATSGSQVCMNNIMRNCYSNNSAKAFYTGSSVSANTINATGQTVVHKFNKVENVTVMSTSTTTGGALWGNYIGSGSFGSEVAYDTVIGCKSNSGPIIGIYKMCNGDVHHCYIANDTSINGGVTGINIAQGMNNNRVYSNVITGIGVTGTGTGSASGLYGINESNALNRQLVYNNMISDFFAPQWSYSNIYGIYLTSTNYTASFGVYHNTIKLSPSNSSSNFGVAGIYFGDKIVSLDLRNNIVNINTLPKGAGIVAALVKNSGLYTGPPPSVLSNASGNNLYYVPSAGFCYYYAEGFNIGAVNYYGPLNDPNFNNNCLSLYKTWMGQKERTSYVENNLAPLAGNPGLYTPSGTSLAEGNAAPVSPAVINDLMGITRSSRADIGALEFSGIESDYYPPVITYAPLPQSMVCASVPPTLNATIFDASGIAIGANAPRMYYRKASEADVFGGANTAAANGWKYVTGTTANGLNYTFTPNYTLLTAAPVAGDTLYYFVIAQDASGNNNVATSVVALNANYCLNTVNLPAAAGATRDIVAKNYFSILAPAPVNVTPATAILCGGYTTLTATGAATIPSQAYVGVDSTFNLNNGDNTPLNAAIYNHRQQMIYTAAELAAQGMTAGVRITDIALNVAFNFGVTYIDSLNIGIGLTTANSLSQGNWQPTTRVYANGNVPVANGLNNYKLNTPFVWDGTSNIVVDFISRKTSLLWAVGVFNTPTTTNTNMYFNDWGTAASVIPYDSIVAHSIIGPDSVTNKRPNLQFSFGAPTNLRWTPVTGLYKNPGLTTPMGATDTNSVVYAAPTGRTVYNVVSVLPGCLSAASGTATVTPINGFAHVYPGGNAFCDSVTLYTPSAANVSYQWQKNGVDIPGATDSAYRTTASGTYRVYVVASGCSDTAAAANITVAQTPVVTISGPTRGCDSLRLTAAPAGLTYQWQLGGANITGATGSTYTVKTSGTYRVYASNTAGCRDTSDVILDTIYTSPRPQLVLNGSILSTTALYSSYQWIRNGMPITGATASTYLIPGPGNYRVMVTNANGCTGTSADSVLVPEGIGSVGNTQAHLFPNPTTGKVKITAATAVNVVVTDIWGRIVVRKDNAEDIDLTEMADGVYTVVIRNKEDKILLVEKLIKK